MRNLIVAGAVALTAGLFAVTGASAFERHFTLDTDRGTISGSAEVFCFDGACYRESELTGVNGNTLKRSGMCVREDYNAWQCKGTVTGPEGNSRTRRFHIYMD